MSRLQEGKYSFAEVEVDARRSSVTRAGEELHLRHKTFQVLLYLLEHPDRLVTKNELIEQVWEGTAVTDDALVKCIVDIRKALGDDPRNPRFVKTVSKGGYRFIGTLEERLPTDLVAAQVEEITTVEIEYEEQTESPPALAEADPRALPAPAPVRPAPRRARALVAALLVVALALATAVVVSSGRWGSSNERAAGAVRLPEVPGRKAVAVMYFENHSANAELDWLREGLADMLITTLSDSKRLTVLSRGQLHLLLERVKHADGTVIRLDEALDVAGRCGAEVIVLGSFASFGGKLRVDVRLHDARDGQLLASDSLVVDEPAQILTQIDLLSLKLASRLGASPERSGPSTNLAEVMTADLGAYRDYSLALERARGLHNAEAIELFEKAVAADPTFAMAHARIGYVYCMRWSYPDKARPYLEEAFRLSDRLTEKDRLYIAAWYAVAHDDFDGAIQFFRQMVEGYPLEVEAYMSLAGLLQGETRYAEGIDAVRKGLAVDPEAGNLHSALGGLHLLLGRRDDAIAAWGRYVELAPGKPNAHDSLGLGYQWFGLYEEAIAEYERALALDPNFEVALVHLGHVYAQTGRYAQAVACYRRYIEIAPSNVERCRGYHYLAELYFRKNERAQGREAARRAVEVSPTPSLTAAHMAAIEGGAAAERAVAGLDDMIIDNRGQRYTDRVRLYIEGRLAFEQGRRDVAIQLLEQAIRHQPLCWDLDPLEDCLANAYLQVGRIDEAIAEYERVLAINPRYPLAHYHLAEAYDRKNEPGRATEQYSRFLETWSEADADIPEVMAARARLTARR